MERCARAFREAEISLTAAQTHTADEFADGLGISTDAVSGALRDLEPLRLLRRGREPGVRANQYIPRPPIVAPARAGRRPLAQLHTDLAHLTTLGEAQA